MYKGTAENKLQGLRALASFYQDWQATTYAEMMSRTNLNTNDISVCLKNGLLERDGDKSTGYRYKYAGDRPPNIGTAKKLAKLSNASFKRNRSKPEADFDEYVDKDPLLANIEFEHQPDVAKTKIIPYSPRSALDLACARSLGEFYMKYRESTSADLQTFIKGFEEGWKARNQVRS